MGRFEVNMIGLIMPCNLKYAPYAQYYIDALKNANIEFEVITWNKKCLDEDCDHVFQYSAEDSNRLRILWGHYRFSRFVKRIIKRKNYSELVIFTIAPLFFLTSVLSKKYNGHFVSDIRDASPFVKHFPSWFKRITSKAKRIVVSSPNFGEWIPHQVNMCHNCSLDVLYEHRNDTIERNTELPIKIACAGSMNEGDINVRFIDAAHNSDLFQHCYIGNDSNEKQKIINHVLSEQYTNVEFFGTYNKEDIVSIYHNKADFVNIIRKESKVNADALPNKLYDAVVSGKPVIVLEHNTAIVKLVNKYSLGIVISEEELDKAEEQILPKLINYSYDEYVSGRIRFIDDVITEQIRFNDIIKELR